MEGGGVTSDHTKGDAPIQFIQAIYLNRDYMGTNGWAWVQIYLA